MGFRSRKIQTQRRILHIKAARGPRKNENYIKVTENRNSQANARCDTPIIPVILNVSNHVHCRKTYILVSDL
jgi:hypothetical protein